MAELRSGHRSAAPVVRRRRVPAEGELRAPDGGVWPAGVYRIDVAWADSDGPHNASWHVELRPGPIGDTPPMLAAARDWARYAGSAGVMLGSVTPRGTESASSPTRLVPLAPAGAVYPAESGVGCGGTVIVESPAILGFAYPADRDANQVRARIQRPFLRRDNQVLMTASSGTPGLILAAPARIEALPGADYVFTVGAGADAIDYALCLRMQSFDD